MTERILNEKGLRTIRRNCISVPKEIEEKNRKSKFFHWTNTFDKLLIFDLIEFDKLVYLDSDMYVRSNIDELFEKEHMSATIDRREGPLLQDNWKKLTSGLLVIEPKKDMIQQFKKIMEEIIKKRESIGDQDILQEYDKEWEKKEELHLDIKYNMFFPHIDYYTQCCNYELDDISVVHFIYAKKPFYISRKEIGKYIDAVNQIKKNMRLEEYVQCGSKDEEKIINEYFDVLENVRQMIGINVIDQEENGIER